MCFGNTQTGEQVRTSTPDPSVKAAATGNLDFTTALRDKGFTPYSGNQVAPFSTQQQSSFGMGNNLATSGVPNVDQAGNLISGYASGSAGSVNANPIYSQM